MICYEKLKVNCLHCGLEPTSAPIIKHERKKKNKMRSDLAVVIALIRLLFQIHERFSRVRARIIWWWSVSALCIQHGSYMKRKKKLCKSVVAVVVVVVVFIGTDCVLCALEDFSFRFAMLFACIWMCARARSNVNKTQLIFFFSSTVWWCCCCYVF